MKNTMTKQELFDKVYIGLSNQGWMRSVNSNNGCSYRGVNGAKCAAGHILPDEEYTPECDLGGGLTVRQHPYFANNFNAITISFIGAMQRLHDMNITDNMKSAFEEFAAEERLGIPVIA